jgi:hypothetical protein
MSDSQAPQGNPSSNFNYQETRAKFSDEELGAMIKAYYEIRNKLNDAGIYV